MFGPRRKREGSLDKILNPVKDLTLTTPLEAITWIVDRRRGLDLDQYKKSYLLRRLEVRSRALRLEGLEAYADYLERHPREADELVRSLSIRVTQFFRNLSFYLLLERRILPDLLSRSRKHPAEILSAGCATGEEAYSIAMLLASLEEPDGARILATDLDPEAVSIARAAEYPKSAARFVPPDLAARFLKPAGKERVRVAKEAASLVTFRAAGLADIPHRPCYDLIVCRNVFIYFEPDKQHAILSRFAEALWPGGYLALGRTERVAGPARELFSAVSAAQRIYQRA